MATFHDLSTAQLRQAIQIREQIESLQAKLDALLGGTAMPKPKIGRQAGKRTISAEHRAALAAGQKARWAAKKKDVSAPVKMAAKKKGGITAAGRAKLAAAMKARWAAKKKASDAPAK